MSTLWSYQQLGNALKKLVSSWLLLLCSEIRRTNRYHYCPSLLMEKSNWFALLGRDHIKIEKGKRSLLSILFRGWLCTEEGAMQRCLRHLRKTVALFRSSKNVQLPALELETHECCVTSRPGEAAVPACRRENTVGGNIEQGKGWVQVPSEW